MLFLRIIRMKGVRRNMANHIHPAGSFELDRWIRSISRGDRDALESLYHATSSAVYAYALSILKNRYDAEDVLHDCYVAVWNAAGEYRSQDKPMAWLMTITRNLCYKLLQRQSRYLSADSEVLFTAVHADPDDALILQSCMKVLSEQERQIVVLHAIAGCKHREIAAMLDLKTSTVLSKYRRALQKLKACF